MGTFSPDIISETADRVFEGCRPKNSSACTEYERTNLPGL